MAVSLDQNHELALGGGATMGRVYGLSNPFGRGHAFHAFQAQGGSDGSHAVNGAQPCQRAKSRQRHGAADDIRKCTRTAPRAAAARCAWVTNGDACAIPGRHGNRQEHPLAGSTQVSQTQIVWTQGGGSLPASIRWSKHNPRSRQFPDTGDLGVCVGPEVVVCVCGVLMGGCACA
jgi:hypothetical protein